MPYKNPDQRRAYQRTYQNAWRARRDPELVSRRQERDRRQKLKETDPATWAQEGRERHNELRRDRRSDPLYRERERAQDRKSDAKRRQTPSFKARVKAWHLKSYQRPTTRVKKIVNAARSVARSKGEDSTLTFEHAWELLAQQEGRCALSGLELTFNPTSGKRGTRERTAPSLDHIDPAGPTEVENMQWLTWEVNRMKNNMTTQEFVTLCRRIVDHSRVRRVTPHPIFHREGSDDM